MAMAAALGGTIIEIGGGGGDRDEYLQSITDAVRGSDQFSPAEKLAVELASPTVRNGSGPARTRSSVLGIAASADEADAGRLKIAFPDLSDAIDIVRDEQAVDVLARKCAAVAAQVEATKLAQEAERASADLRGLNAQKPKNPQ